MKIFVIDGNIDGILSALFVSFTENIIPNEVFDRKVYQPELDAISIDVPTNKTHVERVKAGLYNYGGSDIIAHLKICLKSCNKMALTIAFKYAHFTLFKRKNVCDFLGEKCVSDFSFLVQKVLHERHLMTGFLRFRESEKGVLYAQYSPDNDITEILAPHFLKRLGATPFIIHDVKRNLICISNGSALKCVETSASPTFSPSQNEKDVCELWQRYYKEINIAERKNIRQQDHFIPRRYRKYAFETWE